jgi:hypothetical protein
MDEKGMKLLKKMDACQSGREWANQVNDLRDAWDKCQRPDWMLWALRRIGFNDDKKYRLYACQCVRGTPLADGRTLWDLLTDARSRTAIEVAERFAEGKATEEERHAAYAAYAAAYAAYAAADAAYAARAQSLKHSADLVREEITVEMLEERAKARE